LYVKMILWKLTSIFEKPRADFSYLDGLSCPGPMLIRVCVDIEAVVPAFSSLGTVATLPIAVAFLLFR
jgi:hypothetical protein